MRSANMRAVRSRDTAPEFAVRRAARRLGYHYRLHRKDLPGSPDLTFAGRRCVIFVHGCFWHSHEGCSRSARPKTNSRFWSAKLDRNRERDRSHEQALREAGWRVLIVWECETKDAGRLELTIMTFLSADSAAI
jgi:DNA mismatch endonuclease (patch repair protein)